MALGLLAGGFALIQTPPARCYAPRDAGAARRKVKPACCICINCKWVDRCQTYHWVEERHEQRHVSESPDFKPADPQIQVFVREEALVPPEGYIPPPPPLGVEREQLKEYTVEYDVFACDASVADVGKWVRLMPDSGFTPT